MASNGTEVYIKLPTGRSAKYDVFPSQKLRELCDKVAAEEGILSNQVRLKYQGKTLDVNKTVAQYGVRVETILKAEFLIVQTLDIVVKIDEDFEEVVISNLETVSDLYAKVASKRGLPTTRLQFKVEGRLLPSSSTTLLDAGLARGTTITATVIDEPAKHTSPVSDVKQSQPLDEDTRQTVLSSFDARGRSVEVAFSFDTTGSMYSYLTEVRRKLRDCCTRLLQDIPNIRISIIAQGDYCDSESSYAVRLMDLTRDVQSLVDFAANVPSTSGGDSPECYELVLKKAQQLDWSEDSAKALIVIGDLHPHPPSYTDQNIWWKDELDVLTGMGVKVYGVQAGASNTAANFYEELAEVSGGCYLNLRHLDVITDMFLAVCYNEAHDDMLDDFQNELEAAGNMTDLKKEMFSQLKSQQEKKDPSKSTSSRTNQRNTREAWWDRTLDKGCPQYIYKEDTDKWIPAGRANAVRTDTSATHTPATYTPSATVPMVPRSKSRRWKKCSIM